MIYTYRGIEILSHYISTRVPPDVWYTFSLSQGTFDFAATLTDAKLAIDLKLGPE